MSKMAIKYIILNTFELEIEKICMLHDDQQYLCM